MINISPILLGFSLITFLLLIFILNKILYKPLLDFMDNRDMLIKNDLENAMKNSTDVDSCYKEANEILLNAKNQAVAQRTVLLAEAKTNIEQKLKVKKDLLEKEYSLFEKSLEEEKLQLNNTLLSQMPLFRESLKAKLNKI